jgi:hypothetical protein
MNIRIRRTRLLAAPSLVLLALVAAGCGMFTSSGPAPATAPDPSTASVVVLYHVHLGEAAGDFTDHNVYLDGQQVGRLNEGEELRLRLAPGLTELSIRPETRWLGTARQEALKYSLEMAKGSTRYLRYRTSTGQGRIAPISGTVYADRELSLVTEREYDARN